MEKATIYQIQKHFINFAYKFRQIVLIKLSATTEMQRSHEKAGICQSRQHIAMKVQNGN